jgi:hypothetical protein
MIWTVLGALGVIAAVIGAGIRVDRKLGLLPRPAALRESRAPRLPPHAPGESPETALAAAPRDVRCRACRRRTRLDGEDRATFDGRELVIQRYRCLRCATVTTRYLAT